MYINDFSMYQCILVCVCVYVDVHLYIYILTYVHGFLMDIWMHIVRHTSMNLLICVYYIYISYIYIYIVYIHISPHQTLQATGRIFFGPDTRPAPTPLPPARLQFRPTFVVPRCSRSTLWFCLDLRWISDCLSRASRFSTVPPEKNWDFHWLCKWAPPYTQNAIQWKHRRKIMIDDDQPWDLRFFPPSLRVPKQLPPRYPWWPGCLWVPAVLQPAPGIQRELLQLGSRLDDLIMCVCDSYCYDYQSLELLCAY